MNERARKNNLLEGQEWEGGRRPAKAQAPSLLGCKQRFREVKKRKEGNSNRTKEAVLGDRLGRAAGYEKRIKAKQQDDGERGSAEVKKNWQSLKWKMVFFGESRRVATQRRPGIPGGWRRDDRENGS